MAQEKKTVKYLHYFFVRDGPKLLYSCPRYGEQKIILNQMECDLQSRIYYQQNLCIVELVGPQTINLAELKAALGGNCWIKPIRHGCPGMYDPWDYTEWVRMYYGSDTIPLIRGQIKPEHSKYNTCEMCGQELTCSESSILGMRICCPSKRPECVRALIKKWEEFGYPIYADGADCSCS